MDPRENGDGEVEPAAAIPAERQEDSPPRNSEPAAAQPAVMAPVAAALDVPAAINVVFDPILPQIEALKKEQAAIRAERKRVSNELRNMEKKRSRLKTRAKLLSDQDLLQVLQMRKQYKANKAATSTDAEPAASVNPPETPGSSSTAWRRHLHQPHRGRGPNKQPGARRSGEPAARSESRKEQDSGMFHPQALSSHVLNQNYRSQWQHVIVFRKGSHVALCASRQAGLGWAGMG